MLDYKEQHKRAIEVCEYNNLGFTVEGHMLEENNHGYKNEYREATDTEEYMWERFDMITPQDPYKTISFSELEKREGKYGSYLVVPEKYKNESKLWVEEEDYGNWLSLYSVENGEVSRIEWTKIFVGKDE